MSPDIPGGVSELGRWAKAKTMRRSHKIVIGVASCLAAGVVLVGIACLNYDPIFIRPEEKQARLYIHAMFKPALAAFRFHCGRYPTTEEGLGALLAAPMTLKEKWNGPYLDAKSGSVPVDPWNRSYAYVQPGVHNAGAYDLSSLGPDGVASSDDITNWNETE